MGRAGDGLILSATDLTRLLCCRHGMALRLLPVHGDAGPAAQDLDRLELVSDKQPGVTSIGGRVGRRSKICILRDSRHRR